MLELKVKVININPSANHPILGICRPLYEYSRFIQWIRDYMDQGLERDQAIIRAMKDCEKEGIMMEFIREHGTEAFNMLFTEFNMEDALEVRGEEKYSEGLKLGTEQGITQGIEQGIEQGITQGIEQGITQGIAQGVEQGVRALIDTCIEFCISRQDTQDRIRQKFLMDEATSAVYLDKYWKIN